MDAHEQKIAALSRWIDEDEANRDRDREALMWHRVTKVAEEAGEVVEAMIGLSGGNPRKGRSHDTGDVMEECLDTALAGLSAVEHLTGNNGLALRMLLNKIDRVYARAGLEVAS